MNPNDSSLRDAVAVSLDELVEASGLTAAEVQSLVDFGALAPGGGAPGEWTFTHRATLTVRTASRLRDDLDLDLYAVSVCLRYLDRIDALEQQLRHLQAQLPHLPHLPQGDR